MDRSQNTSTPTRDDQMMVIFGVFNFEEGGPCPEAFIGKALGGTPGMCIRPAHNSRIEITHGFNAVSMVVRPEYQNIYASAILDLAYLQDVIDGLEHQLRHIKHSQGPDIPERNNCMALLPILDFRWTIRKGIPTPISYWGRGLRNAEGRIYDGMPIFSHQDDHIPASGFWLPRIDIHPADKYLFARPSRNERLISWAIANLEAQQERIRRLQSSDLQMKHAMPT